MNEKIYALFGVIGPLLAYVSIGVSIALSPWFSWEMNALSDLGHAVESGVAPIFNFGLLLTGFFLTIYAVKVLKVHAKWTGYSLVISAFTLQLVAVFDEVYGLPFSRVNIVFCFVGCYIPVLCCGKKILFDSSSFCNRAYLMDILLGRNL